MAKGLTAKEKKKWIDALVSGEFKQGRQVLFRDGLYCCLGVECVVNKRASHEQIRETGMPTDISIGGIKTGEDYPIPMSIVFELTKLNDGDYALSDDLDAEMSDEDRQIPFELIAGLVIEPWNGRD